jgi:hypothetical protein
LRKQPIYEVLEKIEDMIRDEYSSEHSHERERRFDVLYSAVKGHANIAIAFKDLHEAVRILKKLKHLCEDRAFYHNKMFVYY